MFLQNLFLSLAGVFSNSNPVFLSSSSAIMLLSCVLGAIYQTWGPQWAESDLPEGKGFRDIL